MGFVGTEMEVCVCVWGGVANNDLSIVTNKGFVSLATCGGRAIVSP